MGADSIIQVQEDDTKSNRILLATEQILSYIKTCTMAFVSRWSLKWHGSSIFSGNVMWVYTHAYLFVVVKRRWPWCQWTASTTEMNRFLYQWHDVVPEYLWLTIAHSEGVALMFSVAAIGVNFLLWLSSWHFDIMRGMARLAEVLVYTVHMQCIDI